MADIKEKYESMELPLLMLYKKQNELLKEYIKVNDEEVVSWKEVYKRSGFLAQLQTEINLTQNRIDQYR